MWGMNAGLHSKAVWVCEMDRQRRGIKKDPCLPNSPDRNQIELLWDYRDTVMDRYKCTAPARKRSID